MVKTGIGYDIHQLVTGRRLVIGGVEIPSEFGSLGHSDGDVLLHAIVDALLGAATLGDIGSLFPSDDEQWKDTDSRIFLITAAEKVRAAKFRIDHIDGTIILQQPRLSDYLIKMRQTIAGILSLNIDSVSVKATTTDHLGFIGEGKGLGALAVATVSGP